MQVTKELVEYVAELSRIKLGDEHGHCLRLGLYNGSLIIISRLRTGIKPFPGLHSILNGESDVVQD